MSSRSLAATATTIVASIALAACAPDGEPSPEVDATEEVGVATSAITVDEASESSCSTMSVRGLSLQIIAKANCIAPGTYVEIPSRPNVNVGDAVFPYLEQPARDAFVAAVDARPDLTMTVNSMLRTVAQQYLLYHWYQTGQCGIGLAAQPGNSNHETGLALDISQYSAWKSTLTSHGFSWLGSSDPVHFDYTGPGAVDHRGVDVLAFQMLWNEHHPNDLIDEDGSWGPETAARMALAPADGFPGDVTCDDPEPSTVADVVPRLSIERASDVFADGPSEGVADAFEGETLTLVFEVGNVGGAAAADVVVAVELDPDFVRADSFVIERAPGPGGPFEVDPANASGDNPSHDAGLPATLTLHVGAIEPGQAKRARLELSALAYSVDDAGALPLRAWVRRVDDLYTQDAYGGAVENPGGTQTFGDGRLESEIGLDVYSRTRWEWDSERLEGATSSDGAALGVTDGELVVTTNEDGAWAATPVTHVIGDERTRVVMTARRSAGDGPAKLLVSRDAAGDLESAQAIELDLPADGELHTLTLAAADHAALRGDITRLALVPWDRGVGVAAIETLSIEGGTVPTADAPIDGADTGDWVGIACACELPGRPRTGANAPAVLALALAIGILRRRRSERARAAR